MLPLATKGAVHSIATEVDVRFRKRGAASPSGLVSGVLTSVMLLETQPTVLHVWRRKVKTVKGLSPETERERATPLKTIVLLFVRVRIYSVMIPLVLAGGSHVRDRDRACSCETIKPDTPSGRASKVVFETVVLLVQPPLVHTSKVYVYSVKGSKLVCLYEVRSVLTRKVSPR